MENHQVCKITLYDKISSGPCDRATSEEKYKDSLKKSISAYYIDHHKWFVLAADHEA